MDISSFWRKLRAGEALNRTKDRMLSAGAKAYVNQIASRYGTVLDLHLNTVERSLSVTLLLKGEPDPIRIHVHDYTLATEEGKTVLQIEGKKIDTSREWLTELIHDQLGIKQFAFPEKLEWLFQLLR